MSSVFMKTMAAKNPITALKMAHGDSVVMKIGDKIRARRAAKGKGPIFGGKNKKGLVTRGGSCGPHGCNMFGK